MKRMEVYVPDALADYERELRGFFDAMLYKLSANAHKGMWENESLSSMYQRLREELDELHESLRNANSIHVALEAADVANFALIITSLAVNRDSNPFAPVTGEADELTDQLVREPTSETLETDDSRTDIAGESGPDLPIGVR